MTTQSGAVRQVTAYNDAADSRNPMHDDAVAQRFDFKGALVPGVTVFGYLSHALLEAFGPDWLDSGCAHVRLRQPVYDGEPMRIERRAETLGDGQAVERVAAVNPAGEVCALASGAMHAHAEIIPDLAPGPLPPCHALPPERRPALRETFAAQPVLGAITATFEPAAADGFLDQLQEDHPLYRDGVTHPAWLLRQANLVVDQNFDLGPWIHVSSSIANSHRVKNGEAVEIRARAVELFERKGHEYADLDVALLIEGDPERLAMRVLHRVIYRLHAGG